MRVRLIALSAIAWIVVPAAGAVAAQPRTSVAGSGSIGIRLVGAAGVRNDNPLARSYIVAGLAPGTTITRNVEIVNTTRSTADVAVYTAAAGLERGGFVFARGHSRNELSSWTSVSRQLLRLPAGSDAFDAVTVDVPADASPGERYAVVWAEVSAPAPGNGGVTLVNRVGVRMYLSIGPGGALRSNFGVGSLTAERSSTGEPLVVAKIRNTGRRTLDITGALTLSRGPGGLRAGPFPAEVRAALAPLASERVTVRLDRRLPRGPWQARIELRSGALQRSAAATITFPRDPAGAKPGSRRLTDLAGLLGILLAIALVFARRTHRSRYGTTARTSAALTSRNSSIAPAKPSTSTSSSGTDNATKPRRAHE